MKGKATIYGGRFWGMSHQFKTGAGGENERYFRTLSQSPFISFLRVNPSDDNTPNPGELEPYGLALTSLSVPETDDARATSTNWHVYGEDQFKPRQNLTMTVGARIDREELSSEGHSFFDPREGILVVPAGIRLLGFLRHSRRACEAEIGAGKMVVGFQPGRLVFHDRQQLLHRGAHLVLAGLHAESPPRFRRQRSGQVHLRRLLVELPAVTAAGPLPAPDAGTVRVQVRQALDAAADELQLTRPVPPGLPRPR